MSVHGASSATGAVRVSLESFASISTSAAVRDAYQAVLSRRELTSQDLRDLAQEIAQLKSRGLAEEADVVRIVMLVERAGV